MTKTLIQSMSLCYYLLMKNFEKTCNSLEDTKDLAEKFSNAVRDKGAFVSLYGEIGAGKTAFVKMVASALGIKDRVTSPTFVILNEYHNGDIPMYHFDLYRLEEEGVKTIIDELREYSEGKILTFVEWAEFSQDEIPFNHLQVNVTYEEGEARKYFFKAFGSESEEILEGLE